MAFDYKKEYKEFYMPKNRPELVDIPEMNFIAVRGKGNPNEEGGAYKVAIGLLYGIAFTIKMSKKGNHKIDGYFDYVVPPLEGFWWQENTYGAEDGSFHNSSGNHNMGNRPENHSPGYSLSHSPCYGIDYNRKEDFCWISVIRLPDFVTEDDVRWAVKEAEKKKQQDFSKVEFLTIREGLCVQCMHIGAYDDEPATVAAMDAFLKEKGYVNDFNEERMHHEIYLSDARRTAPERLKTVIRHPVKKG